MTKQPSLIGLIRGRLSRFERRLFALWIPAIILFALGICGDYSGFWNSSPFLLEMSGTFVGLLLGIPVAVVLFSRFDRRSNVSSAMYVELRQSSYENLILLRSLCLQVLQSDLDFGSASSHQIAASNRAAVKLDLLRERMAVQDLSRVDVLKNLKQIVHPYVETAQIERLSENFSALRDLDSYGQRSVHDAAAQVVTSLDNFDSSSRRWVDLRDWLVIEVHFKHYDGDLEAGIEHAIDSCVKLAALVDSMRVFFEVIVSEWPLLKFEGALSSALE